MFAKLLGKSLSVVIKEILNWIKDELQPSVHYKAWKRGREFDRAVKGLAKKTAKIKGSKGIDEKIRNIDDAFSD